MRGASCLAYQRQFGVEETSRDLAFFAADQLAIWHISESTKYRGVSDALSSTYSHTLNGKDPMGRVLIFTSLHMFSSDFGRMLRAENAVSEVCREWRMSLSNKSLSRNAIFLIFVMML